MDKWDKRFMDFAKELISWSKDHSTGVGAVVVKGRHIVATGFNGFPAKVDDEVLERFERPQKYLWTEHAERNAIYQAANNGVILEGGTMYCTMFPCADCARGIVSVGIRRIVTPKPESKRWDESHKVAQQMFEEAGVEISWWPELIDGTSEMKKMKTRNL